MPNNINNSDSTRQVNRYIKEYSQHLWDSELTGDPEYVIVRHNNKNKSVRSRSKDSTRYYPYPSFEGGAPTIGPGFKLNDTSSFTKKVKTKGFATRDEIDNELERRMAKAYNDVRDIYSNIYGKKDFNSIPQPIINLMSNLAYRTGRNGFRQYKKLMKNVKDRNIEGIIKEYETGNVNRDSIEIDTFKDNLYKDYDYIKSILLNNFYNDDIKNNYVEVMKRNKYDFGGVYNKNYYENLVKSTNDRSYYKNNGVGIKDKYLSEEGELNAEGKAIANQYYLNALGIFSNMQNKINSEILQARGITSEAKYGGIVGTLVGPRRKMYWGGNTNSITNPGNVQWGTEIQPENISHNQYNADGEGIIGSNVLSGASTGLGIGATAGLGLSTALGSAASGTLLGSWAGPIGMGVGALIGSLVGLFGGSRRKKQEEEQRKQLLAQQQEVSRQQTLGNMQNKVENDVATIRNQSLGQYSEGTSFYAKFGGLVGRRRLSSGGVVIPNSNNTAVAYGQTHEQMNPLTGETGIYYGDSEIEGGGIVGNIAYPGEVIRSTSYGDQVFSDTLKVPGTNKTFADYAKKLTDTKGKKDQEVINLGDGITLSLNNLDKSKTNKLKTGTAVRNIEKLAYKMNKAKGESKEIDNQINELFETQEVVAGALGLRDNNPMLRCGGLVRRKMPYGGVSSMAASGYGVYTPNYFINTPSASSLNFSSPIIGSSPKIGFSELGLGMNVIGGIAGMIGNALNARSNRKALEFESKLSVPKQSKIEAIRYNTDYDINQELQELITQERRASRYITDNTSNVSVARNSISKLAIDSQLAKNRLYARKKDYQQRRYDFNLAERTNANNRNNRILYEDALNEYNKTIALNQAASNIRSQRLQGILEGINTMRQAFNNYASGRLYEKIWARGVKNEMRNLAYAGPARRSKRK